MILNLIKVSSVALMFQATCGLSSAQTYDGDLFDQCIIEQHRMVISDLNKNEMIASKSEKTKYWIALANIYDNGSFFEADKLFPHTDRIYDFCENQKVSGKSDRDGRLRFRKGDIFFEENFSDPKQAYRFYKKAHDENIFEGTIGLAWLNMRGKGTPKNLSEALNLGLIAAKSNRKDAQLIVGALYAGYDGESFIGKVAMPGGLKPNLVLSYMWLNIAVSNGHADASHWRKDVEKQMDSKTIQEAQRYSSICVSSEFRQCADGSFSDFFK